ncbi:UNVERIFIED_ORG: hypothetical protein EDC92_11295 [Dietzia maris]|jgi:hypothetical protein
MTATSERTEEVTTTTRAAATERSAVPGVFGP